MLKYSQALLHMVKRPHTKGEVAKLFYIQGDNRQHFTLPSLSTGLQYGEWYRRPTLHEFARLKLQTSWPSPKLVAKGTLHTTMVKGGSYTPVSISVVMAPWHSLVYEKIVHKLEVIIQFRTSVIRRCEVGWVMLTFRRNIVTSSSGSFSFSVTVVPFEMRAPRSSRTLESAHPEEQQHRC